MAELVAETDQGTDQAEISSFSMMDADTDSNDHNDTVRPPVRPRAALAFMDVMDVVAASFGENGKRCYKVQWKDSWVYEDHLFDCTELIQHFWKQQPDKKEGMVLRKRTADGKTKMVQKDVDDVTVIVMSDDTMNECGDSRDMEPEWLLSEGGTDEDEVKENKVRAWNQDIKRKQVHRKRDVIVCHICGEEFDMVAAVRRHYIDNHPGAKPFACDSCGKRFDRKENLSRHIRIHTGDRRYICNHCGRGYTDPSGLKKHVISKHSVVNFPCEVCTMNFKTKDALNRHLTKHLTDFKSKKESIELIGKENGEQVATKEAAETLASALHGNNVHQLQDVINVQQLQQYVGTGTVQVQYIQVTHDPTVNHSEINTTKDSTVTKAVEENEQYMPINAQVLSVTTPQTTPMTTHQQVTSMSNSAQIISLTQESFQYRDDSTNKADNISMSNLSLLKE